ncbi:hypothetical protein ACLOJK_020196 [Asimina triloba]
MDSNSFQEEITCGAASQGLEDGGQLIIDEHEEFDLVKQKVLTDFLVVHSVEDEVIIAKDLFDEDVFIIQANMPWQMYFDCAAKTVGMDVDIIFISPQKDILPYSYLGGSYINNDAEYETLIGHPQRLQVASASGKKKNHNSYTACEDPPDLATHHNIQQKPLRQQHSSISTLNQVSPSSLMSKNPYST